MDYPENTIFILSRDPSAERWITLKNSEEPFCALQFARFAELGLMGKIPAYFN